MDGIFLLSGCAWSVTVSILALMQAEQDAAGPRAAVPPQESPAPAGDKSSEIVVTGRRGEAEVPAEIEFTEDDIAADGSDTIQELLGNLQPYIDPTGSRPVILINGKRAGFDTSILTYPVKALNRVAVLQPEAASRYGARAGTRVVNLVLKPKFSSVEAEAGANAATAGGQYGGNFGAIRTEISGNMRWNAQLQLGRQSALLKSARNIAPNAEAAGGPLDPGDFETLQPSSRSATLTIGVARPIGDFSASVALNVSRSGSLGLRGVATPSPDSAAEGNDRTALPGRYAHGLRALRSTNDAQALGGTLTLTGPVRGVNASFVATFSRSNNSSAIEAAAAEELPANGGAAPGLSRSSSDSETLMLSLSLQRSMLQLPAGPISWSLSASANRGASRIVGDDGLVRTSTRLVFAQSGGQLAVSLPVSARHSGFGALGNLSLDLSLGRQRAAGHAETSYGGGLAWSPFDRLEVRGTVDIGTSAPSSEQLGGPIVVTTERIFDYVRGEFAVPAWVVGGNPLLRSGSQTGTTISASVRPLSRQELALNFSYRQSVATNSPAAFPELTPAIEAAFPERVVRDKAGRLLSVDARPINIEWQKSASLGSGLTLRLGGAKRRRPGVPGPKTRNDRLQVNLELGYQLRMQNQSRIRRGLPVIDRLAISGASRHALDFRVGAGKRALGGSLGFRWDSATQVNGGDATYRVQPPLILNLSSFADLGPLLKVAPGKGWAQGLKLSFDVQNLLAGYRRVRLSDGRIPIGYSRDEVDPIGRTVRLALRKQF